MECECIHFYPDLQYCKNELNGNSRILEYVSLYMKNELCLCNLLKLQRLLISDSIINDIDFTDTHWNIQMQSIINKFTKNYYNNKI